MTIFTIGHENAALEVILRLLQENHITQLVDIRTLPFSRRVPHFNRKRFTRSLADAGITYTYLGNLLGGYPPDPSVYPGGEAKFGAEVDYSAVALRDYYLQGIEELLRLAAAGRPGLLPPPAPCQPDAASARRGRVSYPP